MSKRLKRCFIDTDTLVEHLTGLSVAEIFNLHGETFFRDRESAVITALDRYPPGSLVVATGGGAVLREKNRQNLQRGGFVVLLTASPEIILQRVTGDPERPLLAASRSSKDTVLSLMKKREPYYRGHQLKVDTTAVSPSQVAAVIIKGLNAGNR